MCLVAFAYRYTPNVPLVLISDRGEQRSRATAPAHVWDHLPSIEELTLYSMISDPQRYPDDLLPSTGVPLELEQALSATFIRGDGHETRSRAIMCTNRKEIHLIEQLLDAHGGVKQRSRVML